MSLHQVVRNSVVEALNPLSRRWWPKPALERQVSYIFYKYYFMKIDV